MMLACGYGQLVIVMMLLDEFGVDVNQTDVVSILS